MPKDKRNHDRAPENVAICISMSRKDAELIDRAAEADGRNRSEFLRHYGKLLAEQMINESTMDRIVRARRVSID